MERAAGARRQQKALCSTYFLRWCSARFSGSPGHQLLVTS